MKINLPILKKRIGLLLVLLIIPLTGIGGTVNVNENEKDRSMPKQIGEWKSDGNDHVYDRQTIFKYIDGGAELYLAYDFLQVFSRKFTGPGNSEIVLDMYYMGSPADAFGIFTTEREDPEAGIGQGSEFGGGLLRFWKGNFFVSILATGGDEKTDAAVLEMGKTVAASIQAAGAEPDLLKFLPPPNLVKTKIRYFHLPLQLDKHYYVANENILHLSPKTHCALAEYTVKDNDPIVLLLIKYENNAKAGEAYHNFLKIYMPEATDGLAQMENKKWTLATLSQDMVRIVFEAPGQEQALQLMYAVKHR